MSAWAKIAVLLLGLACVARSEAASTESEEKWAARYLHYAKQGLSEGDVVENRRTGWQWIVHRDGSLRPLGRMGIPCPPR